jgi:hypothetical protein
MAKLTSAELDEIVKQSLPGYKVARRSQVAGDALDATEAQGSKAGGVVDAAHLEDLRQKYLGADFAGDDDDDDLSDELLTTDYANGPARNFSDDEGDDEIIVAVEPETSADPLDRGSRPKAAVISTKEKKVIGQQG